MRKKDHNNPIAPEIKIGAIIEYQRSEQDTRWGYIVKVDVFPQLETVSIRWFDPAMHMDNTLWVSEYKLNWSVST